MLNIVYQYLSSLNFHINYGVFAIFFIYMYVHIYVDDEYYCTAHPNVFSYEIHILIRIFEMFL